MAQAKTKPKNSTRKRSGGSDRRQTGTSRSAGGSKKAQPVAKATQAASRTGDAVSNAAEKASGAVGTAAKRATVPLVAGGAALVGAAGGMALGARHSRRHGNGFAKAAKGAGYVGAQVGRLASEIHQAREAGNGKHRSPVEVVLEGLTARRSRD
jgi:hypothetical protein